MTKLLYIFLFTISALARQEQGIDNLEKVFLDLKYTTDIKILFDNIEKNPDFKLRTTKENFMQNAEFYAKFLGKNDLYPDADSIILHVLTCNDMGTFFKTGANNCKAIKVLYYLKDTTAVNINYTRLNNLLNSSVISNNPGWKNHEGASKGAYFFTDKIYPFMTLDKHTYKKNYLTVGYSNYDK